MHATEESAGRPRRVGRSAAKSTMVKLSAPKAVGLPKPPQIPPKVRETMFVCQFRTTPIVCGWTDMNKCASAQGMYVAYLELKRLMHVMVCCEWWWDVAGGGWYETADAT